MRAVVTSCARGLDAYALRKYPIFYLIDERRRLFDSPRVLSEDAELLTNCAYSSLLSGASDNCAIFDATQHTPPR